MLKQFFSLAAVAAVFSASVGAQAGQTLVVDNSHSTIGFSVKHLMIADVNGSFTDYSGVVENAEGEDLAKAKISFTIKTASVNTANQKRDDHLRGPDFFDSAKHPEITFVSDKITPAKKGTYKVAGDLTMRGVTKKASFDVQSLGKMKNPWGQEVFAFAGTTSLNRKDYGLTWNKALESGGVLVGEDVRINVAIEAGLKQ